MFLDTVVAAMKRYNPCWFLEAYQVRTCFACFSCFRAEGLEVRSLTGIGGTCPGVMRLF